MTTASQAKRAVLIRILCDPGFSVEKLLSDDTEEINQRLYVLQNIDKVQKMVERVRMYRALNGFRGLGEGSTGSTMHQGSTLE